MPALVLNHGDPHPIGSDDTEVDHIREASHQSPPQVTLQRHPSMGRRGNLDRLALKLLDELAPLARRLVLIVIPHRLQLEGKRRMVFDRHRRRRLMSSSCPIVCTSPVSIWRSRSRASATVASSVAWSESAYGSGRLSHREEASNALSRRDMRRASAAICSKLMAPYSTRRRRTEVRGSMPSRRGQSPGNLHAPGRGVRGALSATCSSARVALHSLLRFLSSGGQGETPARSMSCRRTRPVRRPDPGSRSVRAGPALSVLSASHALGRSLPSALPSKGASGGPTRSPFHPSGSVRRAKTTFHRVSHGGSPSRGGRIARPSVDHSMPLGHVDWRGRRPRQQAESERFVRTRFPVVGGVLLPPRRFLRRFGENISAISAHDPNPSSSSGLVQPRV
jgi:hypothetical protein